MSVFKSKCFMNFFTLVPLYFVDLLIVPDRFFVLFGLLVGVGTPQVGFDVPVVQCDGCGAVFDGLLEPPQLKQLINVSQKEKTINSHCFHSIEVKERKKLVLLNNMVGH